MQLSPKKFISFEVPRKHENQGFEIRDFVAITNKVKG